MRAVLCLLYGCGFSVTAGTTVGDGGLDSPDDFVPTPSYFVDYEAGSDTNDGRSMATPWQHAPGDPIATGVPAAAVLVPGDAVLFKAGVVYRGTISVPASGSAGMPISYVGAADGEWGSGSAVIDGDLARPYGFHVHGREHVRIERFELRGFEKITTFPGAIAIDVRTSDTVEIVRCRISDVFYPTRPAGAPADWAGAYGVGVYASNSSNVAVRDSHIRDVGHAAMAVVANDGMLHGGGEFTNNTVTNYNQGVRLRIDQAVANTSIAGFKIVGNTFQDFDQYVPGPSAVRDVITIVARPEIDTATIDDIEIARNYFEDTAGTGGGQNAWIYARHAVRRLSIHHNILHRTIGVFGIRIEAATTNYTVTGDHVIASNVIANYMRPGGYGMFIAGTTGTRITNNIFLNDMFAYAIAQSAMPGLVADYNLFWTGSAAQPDVIRTGCTDNAGSLGGTARTVAEMNTMSQEANSRFADPQFAMAPAAIDGDPRGFKPLAGSEATDNGTPAGFTRDFDLVPIPAMGADIGAFEAN